MTATEFDRTPPQDMATEQAILGCLIVNPRPLTEAPLRPEFFYRPAHEQIFRAITALVGRGAPVEPTTVGDELRRRGELERIGGLPYLADLLGRACIAPSVPYHAGIIRELAARRKLIEESTRTLNQAYGSTDDVETILADTERRLRDVPTNEPDYTGTLMNLAEFCDQDIPATDWIIPGLLGRGDRLVLTGIEGLGKSVLMRQFAACAAAGVHPFQTSRDIPKQTALFVDAENPTGIMVRSFSGIRDAIARKRQPIDPNRLWIERTPAGLDLSKPSAQLWLQRLVSLVNPDLLCIGPAYKLFSGHSNQSDEDRTRVLVGVLDSIRASVNCALIVEHHAGHGVAGQQREMRPRGSSLWLAWPEFGYGIRATQGSKKSDRVCDFVDWRGDREERDWPAQISKGSDFLPWMDASYT